MLRDRYRDFTKPRLPEIAPGATDQDRREFEALIRRRRERQEALANALLEIQDMLVEIANTNSLWMAQFGALYLRCETEYERKLLAGEMLDALDKDPTLRRADLEELVRESRCESDQRLEQVESDVDVSSLRKLPAYSGQSRDTAIIAAERREAGRISRQIWRIVHPDILQHHPAHGKLSPDEREYFEDLQRRLMRPRAAEVGYDASQVGFQNRSPVELRRILAEVTAILGAPGQDVDLDELIAGETPAEQIEFLESDIALLERGIEEAQAERCRLIDDDVFAQRRFDLAVPERHDRIQETLRDQAEAYRREANRIEAEIAQRLGETPDGDIGANR